MDPPEHSHFRRLIEPYFGPRALWIAVMADTGATVLVTLNAMRLLGYRFSLGTATSGSVSPQYSEAR